ncbi:MAG: glucose dehydrogenase [Planctomycetota bacterium]|nr:MAG: glucose dehydrogenase [Planctomycetota bacterium]
MAKREIAGSRALVTGASSGIGREIALELGRRGADVVVLARSADKLETLAAEFADLPGRCAVHAGDVVDDAVRHAAVRRATEAFGGLDILVNNAGIGALGPFETATAERLRRIMEVNFFAAAELIRVALPTLKHGRKPIVANVTSILGRVGIPHSSEYCASKFALEALSQSLRAELYKHGVDVLAVAPGSTETEFFDHTIEMASRPPWVGRNGVPAAAVARAAVDAIASGKRAIVPNFRGWLMCVAQRIWPGGVDLVLRKYA